MAEASRPHPVREAARLWGLLIGGIGAVVAFALSANALTADQATAINALSSAADMLVAALIGVVSGAGPVLASFRTASTSEPKVTPVSDPAKVVTVDGLPQLVSLVPATSGNVPGAGMFDPSGGV